MTTAIRAILLAAALVVAGTACSGGDRVRVQHDEDLQRDVLRLSQQGGSGRLADLTDFDWDTVYVFSEGASATAIEKAVGTPVLSGKYYDEAGNLLVFSSGGSVVKATSVVPDVLATGGRSKWGPAVRMVPVNDRTPAVLQLVDG
jgi:hypothetical protein